MSSPKSVTPGLNHAKESEGEGMPKSEDRTRPNAAEQEAQEIFGDYSPRELATLSQHLMQLCTRRLPLDSPLRRAAERARGRR